MWSATKRENKECNRKKKTLYRGEYKNEIDIGLYFSIFQWENYMCIMDYHRTTYIRLRLRGHESDISLNFSTFITIILYFLSVWDPGKHSKHC